MSKSRLLPHVQVPEDAVQWGPWWVRLGEARQPADRRLQGWDYSSPVTFEIQPTVDVTRALRTSGISTADQVALVAMLDCRSTGLRLQQSVSLDTLSRGDSNLVALRPRPGAIAEAIELSAHLVFTGTSAPNEHGIAWRPGSRLAASGPVQVRLEGDDPRFPTEAVSFKALGMEPAAWTLQVSADDLRDSFLGTVRLLVNSDHPASDLILDPQAQNSTAITSMLMVDVVRQMFATVAGDPGLDPDAADWPEGSIGAVLDQLAESAMSMDLQSAVRLRATDHGRFERKMQAGLDFLKGVS